MLGNLLFGALRRTLPLAIVIVAIGTALGPWRPVEAAEITVYRPANLSFPVVTVEGEIRPSDGEKFAAAVARLNRPMVIFNSPGGDVISGLQIGQVIRLKRMTTFVPDGAFCASSCALAWLGGVPRAMQAKGRVGFHAAFVVKAGEKIESGVGNAVIGAYLNNLGLSFDTIVYIETAHPNEITWLTVEAARRLGLQVAFVPSSTRSPVETRRSDPARQAETRPPDPKTGDPKTGDPRTSETRPPRRTLPPSLLDPDFVPPQTDEPDPQLAGSLEQRARTFAQAYFAHWSEESGQALAYFRQSYADQVAFYGKQADRADLLTGKKRYTELWPVRLYTTRSESLKSFCNEATGTCTVSGLVDWDCRNPAKNTRSTGTANFSLTVTIGDERPVIVGENGSVVARNVD